MSRDGRVTRRRIQNSAFLLCILLAVPVGCAHRRAPPPTTVREAQPVEPAKPARPGTVEKGIASWYGEPYHGRRTASGEVYDMHRLTAAHRTLVFGTVVRVTRRDTGQKVEVRINDRGPFIEGRIIDLSYAAARKIGLDVDGVAPVKVEVLDRRAKVARERETGAPTAHSECWWVQVGAFSDVGNARRAEKRLERAGEHAVVMETGEALYRVRVGPVDSEQTAEQIRRRILRDWPEAQLVICGG
jgi:rare lipoprotein A